MRMPYIACAALILLAPRLQAQPISAEATVAWMQNNKDALLEHPTAAPPDFHPFYSFALPSLCLMNSDLGWICVRWEDITNIRIHPSYPTRIDVAGALFWIETKPAGFGPGAGFQLHARTADDANRFLRALTHMATLRGARLGDAF